MELWCPSMVRGQGDKQEPAKENEEWSASWRKSGKVWQPKSLVKEMLEEEKLIYVVKSFVEMKKM